MTTEMILIPTREMVQSLKVGDLAPDYAGRMMPVTEITAQRDDINGHAFVCYYTTHGSNGTVSGSMKEGRLQRTMALTCKYTSAQLDAIEKAGGLA